MIPEEVVRSATAAVLADLAELRLIQTFRPGDPGAGADFSVVVPGGVVWELLGFRCQFATSAVVATRSLTLACLDGNGITYARFNPGATQAASLTQNFSWYAGIGNLTTISEIEGMLPWPATFLRDGSTFKTQTGNLDAGDNVRLCTLTVREWSPQEIGLALGWLRDRMRA